jgi:hypothetical protein
MASLDVVLGLALGVLPSHPPEEPPPPFPLVVLVGPPGTPFSDMESDAQAWMRNGAKGVLAFKSTTPRTAEICAFGNLQGSWRSNILVSNASPSCTIKVEFIGPIRWGLVRAYSLSRLFRACFGVAVKDGLKRVCLVL